MKRRVAFIHAVGMFGYNNLTKNRFFHAVERIKNKGFVVVEVDGNDNIVFDKEDNLHLCLPRLNHRKRS
ncbi:MAG TPA: hypothetical protein EYP23_01335 [Thermoplasmata archaeon]|nr:hypothetical protein [Thermoplasmata archaeon]